MAAPPTVAPLFKAVEKKVERGKSGAPIMIKTNVYPLSVQKKVPYYKHDFRVKVNVKMPEGKEYTRELTNSSRYYDDDTRKSGNVNVLHALAKQQPFLKKSLVYDRAAILFTLDKIITTEEELTFTLPRAALGQNDVWNTVQSVDVAVKKATDRYQVSSDDYTKAAGADFEEGVDKSIFEMLNIATSQCVIDHQSECAADSKSRIYILNPGHYAGLDQDTKIGDGMILRTSIKKSVKTIENVLSKEGKVQNPVPAIVIDVSRCAMHEEGLISTKLVKDRVQPSLLIGVHTTKTYGSREQVHIASFTNETVANCIVMIGETKTKLADYLKKQYKLTLTQTNLPAVRDRKGNVYAPETLFMKCQQVKKEQNTGNTSRAVILANATPGDERMATIESLTSALHLDDERAKQMGVQLQKNTAAFKVSGRMLPSKKLVYGDKSTTMGFQRGEKKVFFPVPVSKWAFLVSSKYKDYSDLVATLQRKGKAHGMTIAEPLYQATGLNPQTIAAELGKAAAAGCTYALIVSDYDGDHDAIKVAEREYGILTQQMKGRTAEKAHADTGSNLVLKMNVKNGGLNHVVGDEPILQQDNTLIMSLVFDHPSSLSKKEMEEGARPTCPAVVGISSNAVPLKVAGKNIPESCQNFTEKFAYANPREWKKEGEPTFKDTVFELIRHEIEAFKNSRGKPAMKIIVYVSGVPEAERGYWNKEGRALVNDVCHTFSEKYNPATTIITLSTEGCERFVPADKLPNQRGPDPRIGLVVDTVVVNPKVNEWFLQSAKALKGTPRTIKYTLVSEPTADAAKMTIDQLQMLTWSLAHLHQYCLGTIGYPSPSRIAADAAKRARTLFKQNRNRAYDLEELNTTLGFKSTTASATTRSV